MLNAIEERQMKIINHLKAQQFATISELVALLNYSEATIKRDLVQLEQKKLIRRTRGGAMIIDTSKVDLPYLMKINEYDNEKEKEYMAEIAQSMIADDMVIFLDSSTTSLHLVSMLTKFKGLQVITNGVMTASVLSQYTSASVSILGGVLVPNRFTVNGAKAFNDVLMYNADISFVSCKGFDIESGATESHEGEAMIKQAFRRQSSKLVLLTNYEKIGHKYVHQSLATHDIDYLITDHKLEEKQQECLEKNNIVVCY